MVSYSADNPTAIGERTEMYNYLEFIKSNIKGFALRINIGINLSELFSITFV